MTLLSLTTNIRPVTCFSPSPSSSQPRRLPLVTTPRLSSSSPSTFSTKGLLSRQPSVAHNDTDTGIYCQITPLISRFYLVSFTSSHVVFVALVQPAPQTALTPVLHWSRQLGPTHSLRIPRAAHRQGGGGGQQDGSGQPNIQSSAQLYLYTFLATLILLLGVSSAIVVRSLLLRRRHRRMVAEAIANGTWIPPAPRVKVDLRKKPRVWDVWVGPPRLLSADDATGVVTTSGAGGGAGVGAVGVAQQGGGTEGGEAEGEGEGWDGIMPFAASYLPPGTIASSAPPPAAAPNTNTNTNTTLSATTSRSTTALSRQPTPNPSAPASEPTIPIPLMMEMEQPRVRVSVLIAMPAPGMFVNSSTSPAPPAPTTPQTPTWTTQPSPTTPSWLNPTWTHAPSWAPYLPPPAPGDDPDEVPLPHLEVGVASVGVVAGHEEEEDGARDSEDDGKGKAGQN
ncbi:hypothetical protein MVEN_01752200 [Mycena venus]|uniref:Uncharacterized protein n=1 Tax=Mycena venus TaxID=2733690 RepID=A0A8H7CMI3_9AGAR|nr:hypothetical protein MVEN_01752200 [Mycena venus]